MHSDLFFVVRHRLASAERPRTAARMKARRLEILADDRRVGELREADNLWGLEYAPAWAVAPDGFDLSPALPRTTPVHSDGATLRTVQWYFDNLLPEDALRTVLAKEAGIADEDAFGLLAYFGAESAGSLVLRAPGDRAEASTGLRPLSLEALDRRIHNLPTDSLTRGAAKRMALAGAQHKMVVVLHDGQLFEPLPGTPSTHILKPNQASGSYPASVMNEFFTMRLAKAVGLDVPAVYRRYVPQPIYVVERFDRSRPVPGLPASRLHSIDACQLLNKARSFKYTAATAQTLAQTIEHCRAKAAARLHHYRWLLFNVLVGNGDNHLKNVSFLVSAQGIGVALAYDLLCTAAYATKAFAYGNARWPHVKLALSLGNATAFSQVRRAHLLAAGEALGISGQTAQRELDAMTGNLPGQAMRLLAQIEAAFDGELARSPNPEAAKLHRAGELRLLRSIVHVVVADMVARVVRR